MKTLASAERRRAELRVGRLARSLHKGTVRPQAPLSHCYSLDLEYSPKGPYVKGLVPMVALLAYG